MTKPSDLVQGTLDLLLLKILALEPLNGFAISQRLRQVSGEVLQVSDGSLYPALHRMEQDSWISSTWEITDKGRKAKVYSITARGRKQLADEHETWDRLTRGVTRVLRYSSVAGLKGVPQVVLRDLSAEDDSGDAREVVVHARPQPGLNDLRAEVCAPDGETRDRDRQCEPSRSGVAGRPATGLEAAPRGPERRSTS